MSATLDERHGVLESFTRLLLRVQPDEWSTFVGSEEAADVLDKFFRQQDVLELVLQLNPTGQLLPTASFPPALGNKGIYFVKKKRENITRENCQSGLLVGDIGPSPVEQLITVVEEVVSPLLLSKENVVGWPSMVVDDIKQRNRWLRNEMFVMGGKIQGKPLLPLPEHLDDWYDSSTILGCLEGPVDVSALHSIETVVMEWAHQIRDILSKDSAELLLEGLHPLPGTEFEFWHTRMVNLESINHQLLLPWVSALASTLEEADSCYWLVLQSTFKDVSAGLEEAKDINLHLQPLRILLEEMEQTDYSQLPPCVDRVLCTIRILRARCSHYSSPARIIVLLQEICNLLIAMTQRFLSPKDVVKGLGGETQETLAGVRLSISIIEKLYQSYSTYCSDLTPELFTEEPQPWEFPRSLVFRRMDSFLHRLKTIEELYQTTVDFLKLEEVELGGVRANILASHVLQIYEEVSELIKGLADCEYDPLDPAEEQLDKDFAVFQKKIQDVDRRLVTIFCQGFHGCNCLASAVKLIHMFSSLLERPLIKAEVSPCYSALLGMFSAELEHVKVLYDSQTASSLLHGAGLAIHNNMPPVARQLAWALELQERLEWSHRHVFAISHPVMLSAEAKLVSGKSEEMVGLLQGYREKVFGEWASGAGQDCQLSLEQPLLLRDPGSSLLSVNFSKELAATLREVKYLRFQQQREIPGSAESLFAQRETFQKLVDNLDLIVGWYNEVKQGLLSVEVPLVAEELEAVDRQLASAEHTLFWHHEGVVEYIQEMRDILCNLHTRVQKAKLNRKNITQLMQECSAASLFERKDKTMLLDLDEETDALTKRQAAVRDMGVRIHEMLEENAGLLRAEKSSRTWLDYVGYVDGIVLGGFFRLIRKSLQFLLSNMTPDAEVAPLLEVRLELCDGRARYQPSLETGEDTSLLALMESLLSNCYTVAACVPRLLEGQLSYKTTLEEHVELSGMREEVVLLVVSAMAEGEEYSAEFQEQAHLWLEDPEEFLQRFLALGNTEELEEQPEDTLASGTPSLQLFQQETDACEELCEEVLGFPDTEVFGGWLQSDCRPFKQALLDAVRRRGLALRQHLVTQVATSLQDLGDFIQEVNASLSKPLEKGDYEGLVEMIGHLTEVKEKQAATDSTFELLKETVALLGTYGEEMPEEINLQLYDLPEDWDSTKKLFLRVKQYVAPLQAQEANIIRRKCQQLQVQQHDFWETFQEEAPFSYTDPNPYKTLSKLQTSIAAMESDLAALSTSAGLFKVSIPEYKELKACHRELCLLKELWDMIILVNTSMEEWRTMSWKDINAEQLDVECKKFAEDIQSLGKAVRSWDAFTGLDNSVKNMLSSLHAMKELQNPDLSDQHWQELMQATQVLPALPSSRR